MTNKPTKGEYAQYEETNSGIIISTLKNYANNFFKRVDKYFKNKTVMFKSYRCQKIYDFPQSQ